MEGEDYIPRYEYERLESEYRRLRRKYEETEAYKEDLEKLVSKSRSPPLDCGFVVEKLEDSAIVNLNGALKALPYGTLTEAEVAALHEGKYVFVGRIPDRSNPSGFTMGITKVYDRIVDLEVGEVEELRKEDAEGGWIAEISTGKGRGRFYKRLKENEERTVREGMKVGLLPGTFDILKCYKAKEYSRYEVTKSPGVSFNDIGGLREVKQELIKSIILPMINPEDYSRFGECSRRILMYGPPGCGKTMCAKALASALPNCEFVKVGAGELFSMWLGESEKNVRMVFKASNDKLEEGENDYGVIFFDEIDALAQERGMYTGSSGAPERVTGQLLDILDGFYALHPHLTVIGATNRLHLIDSAFRSRFDKIIEVPKPDREAAYSIASIYAKKIPLDSYLLQEKAGEEEARNYLVSEIVNYLYSDQYVETEIGRIKREDTITGRFIAQIFGYARDKALEERTMLMLRTGAISNEELKKMWDKEGIAEILDASHRADDLLKRYKQVEEIGVTLRHLKEGFDKFVQRRAEEMLASGYEEMPDEETGMHY
ncbi:MAG: 26S protease regulatory subunit [Methanophagales archaeon ANME-1-THS]|nr:MAG: 26S protease regulatory subunit [Methanophagales archaeon ANME-1-THS]